MRGTSDVLRGLVMTTLRRMQPVGFTAQPKKLPDGSVDLFTWICGIPGEKLSVTERETPRRLRALNQPETKPHLRATLETQAEREETGMEPRTS